MIEERARDLGRLIGQSKEDQELKRANEALGQDEEAGKLLKAMEQLRVDGQLIVEKGGRPRPEGERHLPTMAGKVHFSTPYQRLLVTRENFDKLMARAN